MDSYNSIKAKQPPGTIQNQYSKPNHIGSRKNILCVIPVNDNLGIVEYQAKTDIYIDFGNAEPLNLSNLHIRVLDKNLQEVTTNGISVITLLVSG